MGRRGSSHRRSWFGTGTMVEIVALLTLSIVGVLGGLIAVGWLLLSGELTSFDGLLLTSVALLLVVIFSLNSLWTIRSQEFQRWCNSRQRGKKKENQAQEKQTA